MNWARIQEGFARRDLVPAIPTALLCWFLTVVFSVSLAALIFRGPLEVFLPLGVGMSMITAIAVGLYSSLLTSILISVLGTFLAVLLGTLAGYATSRFRFVGHGDLLFFVLSTRMIPPVAVLVFYRGHW